MKFLQDKKQKGIAQILVLLLLVGGLAVSVYLVQQRQIFTPKAAGEAILTVGCGDTNVPYAAASWNLPSGSGYNIYIRAGSNDYQVGNSQTGTWSGTQLPNGPTIVDGGSYVLFASNGANTYSDGPKQVNCATPTPTPAPGVGFYQTCPPPGNVPFLNAWWYLAPGAAYNIYIRAGTQDYQIGTTQENNWRGTQLPNGPNIVTGGSYTLFASNGSNTLSQSEQIVACSALPTPLPLMPTPPPDLDIGSAVLNPSCPNNRPILYAYWRLISGSRYIIYIKDESAGILHRIGTTQTGNWTGTQFSDGTPIVNDRLYTLMADNGMYTLYSYASPHCGGTPAARPCIVGWTLSNSSPQPNTNITVKVRGTSDPGGWQNVDLMKDGSANGVTWRGITNPWPTFNYTVNSGTAGAHTLSFKTNNRTKTCTPTVSFTTVNPKPSQKWWQ